MNSNTLLAGTLAIALLAIAVIAGRPRAHDIYSDWRMPDAPSMSCCNDHDCRPVKAESDIDGNWTVLVDGLHILVPRTKIMSQPSPDGRSHWCGIGVTTYCFRPGEVRG